MDPRLEAIADSIARDMHSGASDMLIGAASSVLSIPEEVLAGTTSQEWVEFGIRLHRAKPSIATLFNLANTIMLKAGHGSEAVREAVAAMMRREALSAASIARVAEDVIKAERIVTSSHSSTVREVLASLASRKTLKVAVAQSIPGGEGAQFAKMLHSIGIRSEIVPDSNIFAVVAMSDCVLTGADSLSPHGLVNKVGTRAMVEAARCHEVPAYAVCGLSKISPIPLSDMVVTTVATREGPIERSQIFEEIPVDRFSSVITENGALTIRDIEGLMRSRKMDGAWSSIL